MIQDNRLPYGPLGPGCYHLCIDMQRLFVEETDWFTPWATYVLPQVLKIARAHPERTIFTRFVPLTNAAQGVGAWRRYYEFWQNITLERLDKRMVDLVPDLAALVPPAHVIDKAVYSPWYDTDLDQRLKDLRADTLVITGGETDVCVLGAVLGAVDRGYRVIVVTDALCSSSDESHDALMSVYTSRYGQQVEVVTTDVLLANWLPT